MLAMLSLSIHLIYTSSISIHLICYHFLKTSIFFEGFGTNRAKLVSVSICSWASFPLKTKTKILLHPAHVQWHWWSGRSSKGTTQLLLFPDCFEFGSFWEVTHTASHLHKKSPNTAIREAESLSSPSLSLSVGFNVFQF